MVVDVGLGLLMHAIGDYALQSHWMATEKTKRASVAVVHALAYSTPFVATFLLGLSPLSLAAWFVIVSTHAVIDHYRLARYAVWLKEHLAPTRPPPFSETVNGYPKDIPVWLSTWLIIIVDNCLHVVINTLSLRFL